MRGADEPGMRVLVVNAGSSSLKLAVLGADDEVLDSRDIEAPRGEVAEEVLVQAVRSLPPAEVAGHRVVHGGRRYREAVVVDDEVAADLAELAPLAPLHQETSLAALRRIRRALPEVPAVACFDTAFHADLPAAAATYAIPAEWRDRWGLRRYGFHGLSHAHAARRAAELAGVPVEDLRIVTCHLGAGASLAAVAGGRSVDTTMGFTPLEGLVMATRSGSVDPGLLLWLLERTDLGDAEIARALEHRSGLLALAGSGDMRAVLAGADAGEEAASAALDVYLHRLRGAIASMTAAMAGLDVLVFTGAVGERSPAVRERAAAGLGFLGVELDPERNRSTEGDAEVGAPDAAVRTFALEAREDLEIARQARAALSRS